MRCGLLGEHLTHSYSPQIHALLGDYSYELFEVTPERLGEFLRSGCFDGLNVTIPYKKAVIPYCSGLSEAAKALGSVNTILRRPDGSLYGDNTDVDGFRWMLSLGGGVRPGEKALVLGSGGASQTVQAVLRAAGAEVTVLSRQGENRYSTLPEHKDARLVVNATPVGMYPKNGERLIDLSVLPDCRCVLDLIYNPARTRLLLDAEARGIRCINGLSMLVAQAKRAAELFLNTNIDDRKNDEIYETLSRQMKNIVLVGMPGCGKSTVGKALAKRLSRPFFDADQEIVKRAGKSIPEIFQTEGEAGFRKIETEVLFDLCRQSGAVIATGGGAVTVPQNHDILRQNSLVVFLNRDIAVLPTNGRPLSEQNDLHEMFRQRLPLYRAVCDYEVDGNSEIQTVTDRVAEVYAK